MKGIFLFVSINIKTVLCVVNCNSNLPAVTQQDVCVCDAVQYLETINTDN